MASGEHHSGNIYECNPFGQRTRLRAVLGNSQSSTHLVTGVAFAGEAFSAQWQATAHGAYASGRDVAARLATMLS